MMDSVPSCVYQVCLYWHWIIVSEKLSCWTKIWHDPPTTPLPEMQPQTHHSLHCALQMAAYAHCDAFHTHQWFIGQCLTGLNLKKYYIRRTGLNNCSFLMSKEKLWTSFRKPGELLLKLLLHYTHSYEWIYFDWYCLYTQESLAP